MLCDDLERWNGGVEGGDSGRWGDIYIYIYTYIHIYIYTYTYTHTYIHTHNYG